MSAAARPNWPQLPQAFFLESEGGQRFCLYHAPQGGAPRGRVLYLHPFAEELNSTRRVVARQARALARAGFGVLQIDLAGCGDSAGEFADATWAAWLQDALAARHWLADHAGGPLWLWGLRAGAVLAAQLASLLQAQGEEAANLLLWQPVASGRQMLQQFMRLHAASQWLGGGKDELPPAQALAQGRAVHIAGYCLSPALAQGLAEAQLPVPTAVLPPLPAPRLLWLELSSAPTPTLSPAADKQLNAWRTAGWRVEAQAVAGPAFWQSVGTDEAPALIESTLAALARP
ncbi:MAG: hydrolase 2, exosortase A system-associated [Proteobacteria bacterium]|nr:hydrolase 2, exosortase A system-associated [Pseudomonadota bacterium]